MFHRILVAVDSTNARHQAVQAASELARVTGATLRIVHIEVSALSPEVLVEMEDKATAQRILDEAVAAAREAGVETDGELLSDLDTNVANRVSASAQNFGADLVVLSPHHHSPLEALFSPRVSDAIAHTGKFAVLLLPRGSGEK